jgi:2-hydroxy-6-oxonona-2,4-dienedioate hydrolase
MALRDDLKDLHTKANGYDIRYIEKGNGRPLVCLHGLGAANSGDQWIVNIDALSSVAHVYCPDLPGWGLSSMPDKGYSFPMLVETVKGFCDSLGLEEVDVAGQSLGGWIAALYAHDHPERVRRVILVGNAGLNPPLATMSRTFQGMNRDQLRNYLSREWTTFVPINEGQVDELERRMNLPGRAAAYEGVLHAVHDEDARAAFSLRDRLPNMQQPVLVVWGDNAPGIKLQYGIEAFQLAPNGRLVVTYGGNHSAMGFTAREFESAAISFLGEETVAPAK